MDLKFINLKNLSDSELLSSTRNAVATERAAAINVVRHFTELFIRRTYAVRGYSSMFLMAVEEFGYDKASAQRRVNAMELSRAVPEVLDMIDQKVMCLQTAADIQTFLNKERGARKPYSIEQKKKLVRECAGMSTRDVQRYLATLNPKSDFKESKRFVSADRLQITYTVSTEVEAKLDRLKEILGHVNPFMSREELIDFIAEIALHKLDPIRKAERAEKRAEERAAKVGKKSAPVPAQELRDARLDYSSKNINGSSLDARVEGDSLQNSFVYHEEKIGDVGEIQLAVNFGRLNPRHFSFVQENFVSYESERSPLASFSALFFKQRSNLRSGTHKFVRTRLRTFQTALSAS